MNGWQAQFDRCTGTSVKPPRWSSDICMHNAKGHELCRCGEFLGATDGEPHCRWCGNSPEPNDFEMTEQQASEFYHVPPAEVEPVVSPEMREVANRIHAYYSKHFLGKIYDPKDGTSVHIESIEEILRTDKFLKQENIKQALDRPAPPETK